MRKLTYEYVASYFKEQGCELLERKYINNRTKIKYICSCKNVSTISFDSFKKGSRCRKCSGCEKFTFKNVYNYFLDNNCELLENNYKNSSTPMNYKCNCGNISKINFNNFRKGKRCKKCAGLEKYSFLYVKNYFLYNNCKLLEIYYINIDTPMKYKCNCGRIDKITFYHFKNGQRCKKCAAEKRSGENHWNYNPDLTDEERINNKSRHSDFLYIRWRRSIFIKDKYICQKCFKKGKRLNAHHIESWASNKKLRLIKSNGITLCENCHKKFHRKYGKINNNQQQLDDYLNILVS